MERTCPSCGTAIADDTARHCPQCGTRLDVVAEPASSSSTTGHRSMSDGDRRNWAVAAHLSAFLGAFLALAFLGPLVVWLVKRDEDPFVAEHAREALNFNLTLLVWIAAGVVLALLLIGFLILAAVGVGWIILTVVAAVKASNGEDYRYPLTIRFIS